MVKKRKLSKAKRRLPGASAVRYTARNRNEVLAELGQVLLSDVSDAQFAFLYEEFFGDIDEQPESASIEAMEVIRESSHLAFTAWAFFDARSPAGKLWLDFLVERTRRTPGTRAFVRAMRRTRLALYEVVAIEPGASVTVRGAIGEHPEVTVLEVSASHELRLGQLIATRILTPGASGEIEMDGGFFSYRDVQRAHVLEAATKELALLEVEYPERPAHRRWPELAPLLHREWRTRRRADAPVDALGPGVPGGDVQDVEGVEPSRSEEAIDRDDAPTTVEQL